MKTFKDIKEGDQVKGYEVVKINMTEKKISPFDSETYTKIELLLKKGNEKRIMSGSSDTVVKSFDKVEKGWTKGQMYKSW